MTIQEIEKSISENYDFKLTIFGNPTMNGQGIEGIEKEYTIDGVIHIEEIDLYYLIEIIQESCPIFEIYECSFYFSCISNRGGICLLLDYDIDIINGEIETNLLDYMDLIPLHFEYYTREELKEIAENQEVN